MDNWLLGVPVTVAGDLLCYFADGLFKPDCLVAWEYDVFKTQHSLLSRTKSAGNKHIIITKEILKTCNLNFGVLCVQLPDLYSDPV